MSERKIARFLKEGRGDGHLQDYRPWLTVRDVPSIGLSTRIQGAKTGRIHHLLSSVERAVFLDCDWNEAVIDIQEQFPLDRAETIIIAERMRVAHPSDGGVDVVMTTDMLVTYSARGTRRRLALSVKLTKDLEDERTVTKLEIERRYWKARAVPYRILTERETVEARSLNRLFFEEWRSFAGLEERWDGYWRQVAEGVLATLVSVRSGSLIDVLVEAERVNGWASGDALAAVRHLVASRRLRLDLDVPFDARMPVERIEIVKMAGRDG